MKCFIHLNNDSTSFCTVCKRPICNICEKKENGICPRCANFTHKTIYDYNKRILLFLLIIFFLRVTFYYDVLVLTISKQMFLPYTSTGVLVIMLLYLPFCINIIRYGVKNAVKYQVFGKTSAIEIADNKKMKLLQSYIIGILIFIGCCFLYLLVTPMFIVSDLIHFIKSIKDFFYHKKRILSETQIKNLR